ncbi:MAG: cbb3-type cytochrome c oxidase subunit II, partial [Acidimicrobiia bacterium]
MSDQLTAAAAALGLPESLVQRSAEARAAETGSGVDDILAAWAGGAPAPAAMQAPSDTTVSSEEPEPEVETPASPDSVVVTEPQPTPSTPEPAVAGPYKAPVLVGVKDSPMAVMFGAMALFAIIALVGLVGPSLQAETPGARTSEIPFSAVAEDGQPIYLDLGCAACHTQMVRPVIADVGLGAVTLNDSNQILGTRRLGPDLSNVGARMSPSEIQGV